jgi:hypothetical protein
VERIQARNFYCFWSQGNYDTNGDNNCFTNDAQPIASNLERNDTSFSYIGTGMSQSSGVFTFPSTGIYLVKYNISAIIGGNGTESKTNPLIEIKQPIAGDKSRLIFEGMNKLIGA